MIGAILAAALVSLSPAEKQLEFESVEHNTLRPCRPQPAPGACKLRADITAQQIEALLAGKATAYRREGDQFVVVARRHTDQAYLCCAARGKLDRVSGDLWAIRLRIADLDRGVVEALVEPQGDTDRSAYRGPLAPPRPVFAQTLQGHIAQVAIRSRYLGESRRLTIYTPPGFDPARRYPVVYMADGVFRQNDPKFIEPLILNGDIPPMVMVAVWPGVSASDLELRSKEYLLGWPTSAGRFAKSESFLLNEVMVLAQTNYGASDRRQDRMITGFSSGAAWAVSMGVRNPTLFGHIAAFSVGWPGAEKGVETPGRPPLFLSGGTLEPVYFKETQRLAQRARLSGGEVVLQTPVSGHTGSIWAPMLVEALKWAFGKPAAPA